MTVSEESSAGTRTYESATARLDEIIQRLDSGDAQLRETLDLCEEAKGLIEFCAGELAAVDQGLKELKLEDLATSLTGSATTTGSAPETETSQPDEAPAPATNRPVPTDVPPPPPDSDIPF